MNWPGNSMEEKAGFIHVTGADLTRAMPLTRGAFAPH